MADSSVPHFPDVDEYVWLIENSDDGVKWWPWTREGLPVGALAPQRDDPHALLEEALSSWFIAIARADDLDVEDMWVRASMWRVGRVVDGGLTRTTPRDAESPALYGRFLYRSGVAPDAVEVRTPYQVVRLIDAAQRCLLRTVEPSH